MMRLSVALSCIVWLTLVSACHSRISAEEEEQLNVLFPLMQSIVRLQVKTAPNAQSVSVNGVLLTGTSPDTLLVATSLTVTGVDHEYSVTFRAAAEKNTVGITIDVDSAIRTTPRALHIDPNNRYLLIEILDSTGSLKPFALANSFPAIGEQVCSICKLENDVENYSCETLDSVTGFSSDDKNPNRYLHSEASDLCSSTGGPLLTTKGELLGVICTDATTEIQSAALAISDILDAYGNGRLDRFALQQ